MEFNHIEPARSPPEAQRSMGMGEGIKHLPLKRKKIISWTNFVAAIGCFQGFHGEIQAGPCLGDSPGQGFWGRMLAPGFGEMLVPGQGSV